MKRVALGGICASDLDPTATSPYQYQTQVNTPQFPLANTNAGAVIGDPGSGTTSGSGPTLNWTPSVKGQNALQGWVPALSEVQIQAFDPDASLCEPDTYLNYGNKKAFWGAK